MALPERAWRATPIWCTCDAVSSWPARHLSADERASATVYTSGEHCPMCSAAHAWVGLGRIVYVSSTDQMMGWLAELDEQVHELQRRRFQGS
jgi:tRNA(Arg) A34 adenosine deaminase TadA